MSNVKKAPKLSQEPSGCSNLNLRVDPKMLRELQAAYRKRAEKEWTWQAWLRECLSAGAGL